MEEKVVKFSEEQAFQLLCAALQNGAITLPFGKEIKTELLRRFREMPQYVEKEDIVKEVLHRQLEPCARADAAYLLAFYSRLVRGISE